MPLFHEVSQGQAPRVLQQQISAPPAPRFASNTATEIRRLLDALPSPVRAALVDLEQHGGRSTETLVELNVQIGRHPEAIYADRTGSHVRVSLCPGQCTRSDIDLFQPLFMEHAVSSYKRVGIPSTLHRLSLTTHPCRGDAVIAVTMRVGRAMHGVVSRMAPFLTPNIPLPVPAPAPRGGGGGQPFPPPPPPFPLMFAPSPSFGSSSAFTAMGAALCGGGAAGALPPGLSHSDVLSKSLLLIGRPGVGKTTLLRELASTLSSDMRLSVVVVDKTCEIAGDGESPHPAIGSARWMPVGLAGRQASILREAVENQTPDIIICDEISTSEEVEAVRSISQRGVRLIATVHGTTLPELVNDGERRNLVGGQSNVTLTDAAAQQRADKRKSVAVRLREPAFEQAIELHERDRWVWHPNMREAVDGYYSGEPVKVFVLEPGRVLAAFALPTEDRFEYCLECGRLGRLCAAHALTHGAAPAPAPEGAYGAGGGGAGRPNRRGGGGGGRAGMGGQRGGVCHGCGLPGHHRFECPNGD
ncbi:hypothetical protein FOA52_003437 [Chlamydomonas sp. UWO 241]|nr:hypothetical protein FOA52_003437 [Chlamydomonas sp. UWO 241]